MADAHTLTSGRNIMCINIVEVTHTPLLHVRVPSSPRQKCPGLDIVRWSLPLQTQECQSKTVLLTPLHSFLVSRQVLQGFWLFLIAFSALVRTMFFIAVSRFCQCYAEKQRNQDWCILCACLLFVEQSSPRLSLQHRRDRDVEG